MKKFWKILLWILGVIAWFFLLMMFWMADLTHGTSSHLLILIITGICLAIYIWKKTGSGVKELEKENQELKEENQELRQQLQDQAVRRAIEKADQHKTKEEEK